MRPSWKSNTGFLLSAAGSAIGLGNIWKFPYIAGVNGGGFFVLFYLACVMLIALPTLISEISIGQRAQASAIKSFTVIEGRKSPFQLAGILGVLAAFIIISFYGVVGGWIIFYTVKSITSFEEFSNAETLNKIFDTAFNDVTVILSCQVLFMAMVIAIVAKGVNKGIEMLNKIAIPFLGAILVLLLITVTGMEGFNKAFDFLFSFNMSSFTFSGALEAVGHSFFTISVGVGIMVTYGSYLPKNARIGQISLVIILVDTLIALISGLIIFTILFSFDSSPGQGPVLMFKTLPYLFARMSSGAFVGPAFFILVLITAITSAISLLEVPVAYLSDLGLKRNTAVAIIASLSLLLGIPCALSFNMLAEFTIFNFTVFDLFDSLSSKILLPLSGLLCVLFFAYRMNFNKILNDNFKGIALKGLFTFALRIFAPISIAVILFCGLFL